MQMTYKQEDFVPYYKELKQHALNLTKFKAGTKYYQHRKELAEDIVQNVFLRFYSNMNINIPLDKYLHKLIRWQSLLSFNDNKGAVYKTKGVLTDYETSIDLFDHYSFNNTASYINLKDTYKIINTLSNKKEKMAVMMSYEGYLPVEIAKKLNTSNRGATMYVYRGKQKLRKLMMD